VIPLSEDAIPAGAPCTSVDYAYEVAPAGSTFGPAVLLIFTIPSEEWSLVKANQPIIISFNPDAGAWTEIPTELREETRTLTGHITHSGTYAICMKAPPPTTLPTEPPVTPTQPGTGGFPFTVAIPIIVLLVVALGALVYFMSTRRWKGGPPPEEGS
jgi:hypothetical protein